MVHLLSTVLASVTFQFCAVIFAVFSYAVCKYCFCYFRLHYFVLVSSSLFFFFLPTLVHGTKVCVSCVSLQLQIYFKIMKDNVMPLCSNTVPWKHVGGVRIKIHAFKPYYLMEVNRQTLILTLPTLKKFQWPLDRRSCVSQNCLGLTNKEKKFLPLPQLGTVLNY